MSSVLNDYLHYCRQTESPVNFHRWSFISMVGAMLGQRVFYPFMDGVVHPNQYIMLVGTPGTRKTTAVKYAENLAKDSGYNFFAYNRTTKEKFLLDWQTGLNLKITKEGKTDFAALLDSPFNPTCAECFICNDEFIDFIGINNLSFIATLTKLWDTYDIYEERFKNSQSICIQRPILSLLAGITTVSMQSAIPQEASGSGFLSRMILVYGHGSPTKITFPRKPSPEEKQPFISFFKEVQKMSGELIFTPAAIELIDAIYQNWEALEDSRLAFYATRRLTHLFKLCQVIAVCHGTLHADTHIVEEAHSILCFTERTMDRAMGEFGKSRHSEAANAMITALESQNKPLTMRELFNTARMHIDKFITTFEIINNLHKADRIIQQTSQETGEAVFILNQNRKKSNREMFANIPKYIKEAAHHVESPKAGVAQVQPIAIPTEHKPPVDLL